MIREYPKEIQKCLEICEPYRWNIKDGEMLNAPQKVIDAFNKFKKWAWEQGQ